MRSVLERGDEQSRAILDAAIEEARQRGHGWIGTEHVLLALAGHTEVLPAPVAGALPGADRIAAALVDCLDRPPRRDAELLKTVGIDLDQVRGAVRRTFGDAAVEGLGRQRVRQPWQPWRRPRRRCLSMLAGTMNVAPRLKRSFEQARFDAERRHLGAIDPAALLAGMLEVDDAMASRILRRLEVDPVALRRQVRAATG